MGFENVSTALGYSLPLAIGIAAVGSGIGLGLTGKGGMEAMGRQPEAAAKIQTAMIIGMAFSEALTIYALVTMFILQGKITG
jgi:F-type H+-transporting ATPase subunit c